MNTSTTEPTFDPQLLRQREAAHTLKVVWDIIEAEPTVEFGSRVGPCVVEFRDWRYNGWPRRRSFSCQGCKFIEHDPEYRTNYCAHPHFLEKYKSHQSIANNSWYRPDLCDVHAFSCPVLRLAGVADHCPAPPLDEIPGKAPSNIFRSEAEIFAIPQKLPYWLVDAYAAGERVDRQHPTY